MNKEIDFGQLWFVAHYDAEGHIKGIQEHDHYAGGHIRIPADQDADVFLKDLILRRVRGAGVEDIVDCFVTANTSINWTVRFNKETMKWEVQD